MQIIQKRIEKFANDVKGKKNVYCFGAGSVLARFLHEFREYHLEDDIKYVVDNSKEKQETIVRGIYNDIPVISLKKMLYEITLEDVIIITTVHFLEIIELLNGEEKLKSIECYLYNVLRIEQYDYERLNIEIPKKLGICQEQRIPKTIHYCWFGKTEIPAHYKKWMESWKKYCPEYEIVEWNEDNYDVHKSRYIRQAYDMGKWAFVSDYARIDIINEYGGIYLDTDVELVKNIDVLLQNDAFCGFENFRYVAYGLGFGSRKDNVILNEIKEYYDRMEFLSEDGTLKQITCPVIQTEIMKRHGLMCNGEFQVVEGMTVYPSRILCGMSPHSFRIQCNLEDTYAIHHYSGSWLESKQGKNKVIFYMKKWSENRDYYYPDDM
nr:glycosyltransferase [uncultured Acetatifactor sp.]